MCIRDRSVTVRRSVYVPGAVNVTVVLRAAAFPNVTAAGPPTWVHAEVRSPIGYESSVAPPAIFARAGNVTDWSGPALTTGARFADAGVTAELATLKSESSQASTAVH